MSCRSCVLVIVEQSSMTLTEIECGTREGLLDNGGEYTQENEVRF